MAPLRRCAVGISTATDWGATVCLAAVAVLINIQVFYRYVLDNPLAWPEELARNLFIWSVYLGLVGVFREARHYRIDFLVARLSERARDAVALGLDIAALLFFLAVIFGSWRVLASNWHIKTSVDLPVNLIYASLPVAVLLLLPVLLASIVARVRALRGTK